MFRCKSWTFYTKLLPLGVNIFVNSIVESEEWSIATIIWVGRSQIDMKTLVNSRIKLPKAVGFNEANYVRPDAVYNMNMFLMRLAFIEYITCILFDRYL